MLPFLNLAFVGNWLFFYFKFINWLIYNFLKIKRRLYFFSPFFSLDEKKQKSRQKYRCSRHLIIVPARRTDFCRSSLINYFFDSARQNGLVNFRLSNFDSSPSVSFQIVKVRFLSVLILQTIIIFQNVKLLKII